MYEALRAYLGMKHDLVGIKIFAEGDNAERSQARDLPDRPSEPMWYCQMVREASSLGKEFMVESEDIACPNADLCLGFREPKYLEIEPRIKQKVKAVRIGNVEDSDLVLLVLTPEQVMTISILLGGIKTEFKGELAVCGEATARAYMEKKPSLTFLCNGARMFGNFKANELVLAIPVEQLKELNARVENLLKTGGALCGCRVSDIPPEIVQSFQKIGWEKGTDYFFGKIDGHNVRIYLNKDEKGRLKLMTFYVPIKDADREIEVKPPFQVKKRGNWTDIYAIFDPTEVGINLYSGENLLVVLSSLTRKALGE